MLLKKPAFCRGRLRFVKKKSRKRLNARGLPIIFYLCLFDFSTKNNPPERYW
jgi:hypothetical protein